MEKSFHGFFIDGFSLSISPRRLADPHADPEAASFGAKRLARGGEPCVLRLRRADLHPSHARVGGSELRPRPSDREQRGLEEKSADRARGDFEHRHARLFQIRAVFFIIFICILLNLRI